jgi:segregation and condensation protein A
MSEYRVNLDIYNGPMDLLLYLIRREEVDIHNIPIARITEQYVHYVEMLKQLDPNLAGEFLVLAATLMEIKTRMLLPPVEGDEEVSEDLQIDPREDLVRQLLQYKAFKDAAGDLQQSATIQAMRFPRRPTEIELDEEQDVDIEDVQIWDLFDAFRQVMEAIGRGDRQHEVIYDDTPVELHEQDIVDRLEREGTMSFQAIFAGRETRSEMVGLFLALLELVRLKRILVSQNDNFGQIMVHLNPDPPSEDEVAEYIPPPLPEETPPQKAEDDELPDGPLAPPTGDDEDEQDEDDRQLSAIRDDFDIDAIKRRAEQPPATTPQHDKDTTDETQ